MAVHKDLQDLTNLPRSQVLSYLQKQAQPRRARGLAEKQAPAKYPLLAAFSPSRIFTWLREYLSLRVGPRHSFFAYPKGSADQGIYPLEGDGGVVRLALAGDWATGTDEAAIVADLIKKSDPHYAIHLGDVYYVGGPREVGENFLGIKNPLNDYEPCSWPRGSRGSFALNGNHEMYARGTAYFDDMLPKLGLLQAGNPQKQKASFFCLQNDHWRIIALDTGYNSIGWPLLEMVVPPTCALRPEQIDWLRDVVKPRDDDPRGIILLTHHQYYSRFDDWYTVPGTQLAEFFRRPVLWFWGHEHRLAIYPENGAPGGIRAYGRCIGHGGMPVDLPPEEPKHADCPVEFVDRRHYRNDENLTIGLNGFVRMVLEGNRMTAEYVDLHDKTIASETWVVEQGVLRRPDGLRTLGSKPLPSE